MAEFEAQSKEPNRAWRTCPACGAEVEEGFDQCWNCEGDVSDVADAEPGKAGAPSGASGRDGPTPQAAEEAQPEAVLQRPARELWLEIGVVLMLTVVPAVYSSASTLAWPYAQGGLLRDWGSRIVTNLAEVALVLYLIHRSGEPRSEFGLSRPRWMLDPPRGSAPGSWRPCSGSP